MQTKFLITAVTLICLAASANAQDSRIGVKYNDALTHPKIGTTAQSEDGAIKIRLIGKKQNFGGTADTRDTDIDSPKSVHITPDGTKYYVNSLEGCATIAYDFKTNNKLKVIKYDLDETRDGALWGEESGLYKWRKIHDHKNTFMGKPVESTFSHHGRYLWVPFYRRTFDTNAQEPSALAVIDTKTDEIVRMMETGPLPKMIRTSPDGKTIAVSHWGNNTIGLIDISSESPMAWRHKKVLVVDKELELNFPEGVQVDRDNSSGYCLRGTVFSPDGLFLFVGCMGGGGGIAVVNTQTGEYLGRILGMMNNVRHIVISNGWIYLSINAGGYVQRIRLSKFLETARAMQASGSKTIRLEGWESCKVGTGARTICISPDGRYIFAACNNVSTLDVVDTKTFTTVCNIDVDSYSVGLDISSDGRYVLVTSQGRKAGSGWAGGNAVNIYEVEYRHPPVQTYCANCGAERHESDSKCSACGVEFTDTYAKNEENSDSNDTESKHETGLLAETNDGIFNKKNLTYAGGAVGGLLLLGGLYKIFRK